MAEREPDDEDITSEAPTEYLGSAPRAWSRPAEDLSRESLLRHAHSVELDGVQRPGLTSRIALLSKLGHGGMGVVYHAVHVRLGTEVAVKLLPLALQARSEDLVRRFEREAQIAARLRSPHLVSVVDIDQDEATGCHYIVMEYVDGPSADRWAASQGDGATETDAIDLCIAATRGLAAAHLEGVVHRDVKPANILVPTDETGRALLAKSKLADLGLARAESGDQSLTGTALAMGTPGYMAPEQAEDAKRARKPADVFSMGATLYGLLTGAAPFAGSSAAAAIANTMLGKYPPLRDARPDVSPATAMLVDRCLAQDPSERFPDAPALLDALEYTRSLLTRAAVSDEELTHVMTLARQAERGKQVLELSSVPAGTAQPATTPAPSHAPQGTQPAPSSPHASAPATRLQATQAPTSLAPQPRRGPSVALIVTVAVAVAVIGILVIALIGQGDANRDAEPDPAPVAVEPGTLAVQTRPSKAQVLLDGAPAGRTPYVDGGVAPGDHIVELRLAGHEDARLPVSIRPGARLDLGVIELVVKDSAGPATREPPKTDVPPTNDPPKAAGTGTLAAQSRPSGAHVLIDGEPMGRTPYVDAEVPAGEHTVVLRLDGHAEAELPALLRAGKRLDLGVIELTPWGIVELGKLEPGVSATLDGKPLTRATPLPAGKGEVVLTREGYVTQRLPVSVRPGARRTVTAQKWVSLMGGLDLAALPPDATVTLDGRPYAAGDRIEPGAHRVRVSRPGYDPQDLRIVVDAGVPMPIPIDPWVPAGLRYRWRPKTAFDLQIEHDLTGTAMLAGLEQSQEESSETSMTLRILTVDAAGDAEVSFRTVSIRGEGFAGGTDYTFDSATGVGNPVVLAPVGHWFGATITALGVVKDVDPGRFRWPRATGTPHSAKQTASMLEGHLQHYLPVFDATRSPPQVDASWRTTRQVYDSDTHLTYSSTWTVQGVTARVIGISEETTGRVVSGQVPGWEGWTLGGLRGATLTEFGRADGMIHRSDGSGEYTYRQPTLGASARFEWDRTIVWSPSK